LRACRQLTSHDSRRITGFVALLIAGLIVVIAAGRHALYATTPGDYLIAYTLDGK